MPVALRSQVRGESFSEVEVIYVALLPLLPAVES